MANRPNRNKPKKLTTQAEINRVKPVGELSLDLLKQKSSRINSINVKLPDGEIYRFYHLPMTVADAKDFFARSGEESANRIEILQEMVHQRLVTADGQPFSEDPEVWEDVDVKILDALVTAMLESSQTEGGED